MTEAAESDVDIAVYLVVLNRAPATLAAAVFYEGRAIVVKNDELEDAMLFQNLSKDRYRADRSERRNVERWAENIVNATIDIAKIVLASERRRLPQTYRETIIELRRGSATTNARITAQAGSSDLVKADGHAFCKIRIRKGVFYSLQCKGYANLGVFP